MELEIIGSVAARPVKNCFLLILCFIIGSDVNAQSYKGVTNKPDTSYSNYSAFKHSLKGNPEISLVGNFDYKNIETKKNIVYCELGKRSLSLDAFYPKDKSTGRTAFIMIHGGGWRSGNRAQHHPLAQTLASKGYVCFTPEYRLSTEALFPAGIYDVKAAIRWVKSNADKYGVDTAKIVIAGFSAGGELAAFMGTTGNMPLFEGTNCNTNYTSHVNAVVDIDGTLSFVHRESGEGNDSTSISAGTYWFGYSKKQNYPLWEIASPLTYVNAQTPPTLFLNSAVDRMHAGREDYIKVLNENGIYSEVHTFEKSPHSFPLFYPYFDPMVNYIDTFLKKVFDKK
jgi:pectinesterase